LARASLRQKKAPTFVRISNGRPGARRGHAPGLTIPLWPARFGWIDRKSDSWRKSCKQRQATKCPLCDTVKEWIRRNGGLTTEMKKIKNGEEPWKIVDPCPEEW